MAWVWLFLSLVPSGECDTPLGRGSMRSDSIVAITRDLMLLKTRESRRGDVYLIKPLRSSLLKPKRPGRCDSIMFLGLNPGVYGKKVVYEALYSPGAMFGNSFWRIIDASTSVPDTVDYTPGDLLFPWPVDTPGIAYDSGVGAVYTQSFDGDRTVYFQYTREKWGFGQVDSVGRFSLLYSARSRKIDSICADKRKSGDEPFWFGGLQTRIEPNPSGRANYGICFCDKWSVKVDHRGRLLEEALGCARR